MRGRCSFCKARISWLYPAIELATALSYVALFLHVAPLYWGVYGVFFAIMLICIRTDIENMLLLSDLMLGSIPVACIAAYLGFLPLSLQESLLGALLGAGILLLVRWVFWVLRKQEGMGLGDVELLAAIGSFVGPLGVLLVLLMGSLSGSLIGLSILALRKQEAPLQLPFGAFLAAAAMVYVIWSPKIISLFLA